MDVAGARTRLSRHLVKDLVAGVVELTGPVAHHLLHVRRVRPGDRVMLFDGAGREALAEVATVSRRAVTLTVGEPDAAPCRAAAPLTFVFALSKGDKPEWIVQKAVELGASKLVVFAAERSVVHWRPDQAARKLERLAATVAGACAQCGRADAPPAHFATTLAAASELAAGCELRLALDAAATHSLADLLSAAAPHSLALLAGPEGGLTPGELTALGAAGWGAAHLGPRTLRAETAALAALAVAQSWLERAVARE